MSGDTPDDRRLTALTGKDALTFLQGLVTNDVRGLEKSTGIIWTGFLSPQGKYLADFFVVNTGDALLLDMPEALADDCLRRLSMYRLRADVQLATAEDLFVARGLGPVPQGGFADPRHPALGWRSYLRSPDAGTAVDWNKIRVAHLIPVYGQELIPNESYILEWGFERLHGVDFRKGCYVGQEVTARMKHKTELRKGMARVAVSQPVALGTDIMADGKPVGQIFTQSNGQAIAHLRYDRIADDMNAGNAQVTFLGTN